jgi:hypothetical protein
MFGWFLCWQVDKRWWLWSQLGTAIIGAVAILWVASLIKK